MDLMDIRRGLINQMANTLFYIAKTKLQERLTSITFDVIGKPKGLIVTCENKEPQAEGWTILTVSAIWSDYNGGAYFGGRYNAANPEDNQQDNWSIASDLFTYDDTSKQLTIAKSNNYYGRFANDRTYYLCYCL